MIPLIRTIPIVPMTNNQRERAHWAKLAKEKDDWTLLIPLCAEANRQQEGERRMVEIVFCKTRGPESDSDNLHARCKSILDALVRRGWMIDDSPKYIDLRVSETTRAASTQTVIAVSEARQEAKAA
jgi:hypothetical protein